MKADHRRIEEENFKLMNRIILTKPSKIILTATERYLKQGQGGPLPSRGSPAYDQATRFSLLQGLNESIESRRTIHNSIITKESMKKQELSAERVLSIKDERSSREDHSSTALPVIGGHTKK
jgi:hypothetical protein